MAMTVCTRTEAVTSNVPKEKLKPKRGEESNRGWALRVISRPCPHLKQHQLAMMQEQVAPLQ